jgi:hypothetical protein
MLLDEKDVIIVNLKNPVYQSVRTTNELIHRADSKCKNALFSTPCYFACFWMRHFCHSERPGVSSYRNPFEQFDYLKVNNVTSSIFFNTRSYRLQITNNAIVYWYHIALQNNTRLQLANSEIVCILLGA